MLAGLAQTFVYLIKVMELRKFNWLCKQSIWSSKNSMCNFSPWVSSIESIISSMEGLVYRVAQKSALFCFSSQSCVLQFFSIFFRWFRQQAWEILLRPIWIQVDAILRRSGKIIKAYFAAKSVLLTQRQCRKYLAGTMYLMEGQFNVWWPNFGRQMHAQFPNWVADAHKAEIVHRSA